MLGGYVFGKQPVLTCLGVCWQDFSPTDVVCESSFEGSAAQVHSCCSLQFSTSYVQCQRLFGGCVKLFAVRRILCRTLTPSAPHLCAALAFN